MAGSIEGSLIDDTLRGKLVAYFNDDGGYFTNTNPAQAVPAPWPFGDFTYFNPATILNESTIDLAYVGLSLAIIAILVAGGYYTYAKRDLYI